MIATPKTIWYDGNLVPTAMSGCSLLEHGLHYGTGVFEGIRCYETHNGPAIFRLDAHLARLQAGADVLGMTVDMDEIAQAACDVLRANGHRNAYIRPILFYGCGSLGLDVGDDLEQHAAVASLPWKSHLGEMSDDIGVRVGTSNVRRVSASSIPPLKLCGTYVNSILAKREATLAGFDEGLFVDRDGRVCEATGENLFMVKGDEIVAVQHPDALMGITRHSVMEMVEVTQRPVYLPELAEADEIFLTGTSAEVAPVTQLDHASFKIGPVTRHVQALYQDAVHGRLPGFTHWLTPVIPWAA